MTNPMSLLPSLVLLGSSLQSWFRSPLDISQEHPHGPADMENPAIALRIVEHLLIRETGDDSREDVGRSEVGHAHRRQPLPANLTELQHHLARVRRWLEARDRALEQKLVTHDVLGGEPDATLDELHQRVTRIVDRRVL